jgi:hypothetical protein
LWLGGGNEIPTWAISVAQVNQDPTPHEIDPESEEALAALAETRQRIAEAPANIVVVNHVMGLHELAAIHLSAEPPRLEEAALAIDAVACIVEGLGARLGDEYKTLQDALGNIRLAFVQIKGVIDNAVPLIN